MVNGYSAVALTKLDILDDMDEIQIGVTYKKHGEPMEHFPSCEQVRVFYFGKYFVMNCVSRFEKFHY